MIDTHNEPLIDLQKSDGRTYKTLNKNIFNNFQDTDPSLVVRQMTREQDIGPGFDYCLVDLTFESDL